MKPQKFIEKVVNKATKFLNEENLNLLGYSVTGEVLVESGIKNPYLNLRFPNHEVVRYNLREDYDIHEEEDVSISQSFAYIKRNILHDIREYDTLRETESYNLEVESDEEASYDESEELDSDAMENNQQAYGDEDTVNVQEPYDEEVDLEYTEDSFEEDDEEYDEDDEIDVDLDEDEDEIDEDEVDEECDDYLENWSDAQKEEYFSDYDTNYESALGQTMLKFLKWKLPLDHVFSDSVNIRIGEGISQVSFNIGLINNEYQTNSMDFNEFGIELLNRYRDEVRNRLIGADETEQNSPNTEENALDSKDEMEDSSVSEEDYSDDYFPFS